MKKHVPTPVSEFRERMSKMIELIELNCDAIKCYGMKSVLKVKTDQLLCNDYEYVELPRTKTFKPV
jgi:hypothetical protein